MEDLTLKADIRKVLGKKNRFLRRQGITPAHVFGHSVESVPLQIDTAELRKVIAHAGMTRLVSLKVAGEKDTKSVFVKEVQRDALGKHLLHVDFYQVKKGEKMMVEVPIVIVGEAPALKTKGRMLAHGITSLEIECLPEKVPPQIEVDISSLEDVEHAIHVKDLALGPDVTVHADPDQMVVKIAEAAVAEEVEEVAEEEEAEEAAEEAKQPAAEAQTEEEK